MPWVGEPNHVHRCNRYASNNVATIQAQLDNMQAVGIDGVILTWRGISVAKGWDQQVATLMVPELARRKMLFAYLLDPGILKWRPNQSVSIEQEIINNFNSVTVQAVLRSGVYLPEQYVLDFLTGYSVNYSAVKAAIPGFTPLMRHQGYEWPSLGSIAGVQSNHKNPAMKIPGVAYGFNDAGCPLPYGATPATYSGRDYSQSVWSTAPGTQPARVNDPQGGNYYLDCVQSIGDSVSAKAAPYAAIVTWNDHDEGTGVESYVAGLTGIRIGN
jgi:hypothetical protein